MSKSIATLILAAGASKRMGNTIKQLLPWGKTTLLGHALEQAQKVTAHTYVVLGSNANEIRSSISEANLVYNPKWQSGIGSSIATGVKHILEHDKNFDGILVMLADQPMIDSVYLDLMKKKFDDGESIIIATAYENKVGVPAIFHRSILSELLELDKDSGAKQIIEKYIDDTERVFPNGKEIDIDTLEKYSQLLDKMMS
ncbi:nucleotidyltransferase family protein [Flagellimonas sp. 389]|uniref:nucleotidyltransferase family protein n=1 Tax=Flagellimonas sp. 389 TaxID=2835862 RepID=UPI001BD56F9A|nr:nucleotidyltransferase family protein [Flagellimonas sp. 389]MBS9463539.1 nucleotidyltransferase family protein [Flagellimonas sp. 389]